MESSRNTYDVCLFTELTLLAAIRNLPSDFLLDRTAKAYIGFVVASHGGVLVIDKQP